MPILLIETKVDERLLYVDSLNFLKILDEIPILSLPDESARQYQCHNKEQETGLDSSVSGIKTWHSE